MKLKFAAATLAASGSFASAQVFPTLPHAATNHIPFGSNQAATMHQVFAAALFHSATGGLPAHIHSIGFAPAANGTFSSDLTLRLGYTAAIPGEGPATGGLAVPTAGGGGGPNALGPMTTFYANPAFSLTIAAASSSNFTEFRLPGSFVYDPAQGNLLVEIVSITGATLDLAVSRAAGSAESSRAYHSTRFSSTTSPTTAIRMDFEMTPVPEPGTMLALGVGVGVLAARRRRAKA